MLVIVHGWSDSSRSFRRLGQRLVDEGVAQAVSNVVLGDYVSMDDDVRFSDIVSALERAWNEGQFPDAPHSVDVVVHSTGGLVIRDWMVTRRRGANATNPVRRLLMLAPANFGSGLAHKGKSFLGRVVKGFKSPKLFQTGTHILEGLELASPYSWQLAMLDGFGDNVGVDYGPGGVMCTVLVGNTGYSGISAAANENGSDGTVRVSTAHLSPSRVFMDFAIDPQRPRVDTQDARGLVAFCRINAENHSTLALKDGGPRDPASWERIKEALTVEDATFTAYCARLEAGNADQRARVSDDRYRQGYQNTVVHLVDDTGADVCDFFLEVFMKTADEKRPDPRLTKRIQERVIETVHAYGPNASFRSLLINIDELDRIVGETGRPVFISVTALPDIRHNKNVGYSTFGYDDIGSIRITSERLSTFFQRDRTLLIELRIRREQGAALFKLSPLS